MKVLLVDPPKKKWKLLGDTIMPPIGLTYLAAYLRKHEIEVSILDCIASEIKWEKLREIIEQKQPDVIGVGTPTCYVNEAIKTVKLAKEVNQNIITVLGGPHFTFTAEETLIKYPEVDYIVIGEGEITLFELVKAIETKKETNRIKGLAFRKENTVYKTPPRPLICNLDTLPLPAWDLLPMDKYRLVAWGNKVFMLISSRGCTFKCKFCSEREFWGGIWRPHSAQRIVNEMEHLYKRYGKNIIWFGDDTFNISRKRNIEFCNEIIERNLNVYWGFEGRADLILRDKDLIGKMKEAGLFWVLIGVEAASDEELKRYGKNITIKQVKEAFKLLRDYDIVTQAMFIIGERKDTKESIFRKVELAKELNADFAIFTPLTPLPGTQLYEEAKKQGWLEVKDYSKYDFTHAVMSTETLTVEEVNKLVVECYKKFYLRPLKIIRGIFSRNKFRRAVNLYFFGIIM